MAWSLGIRLLRLPGVIALLVAGLDGRQIAVGLAAVAVAGLVLYAILERPRGTRSDDSSPVRAFALSLRRRASATLFLRLRDPGAAGRPRPRAPGRTLPVTI